MGQRRMTRSDRPPDPAGVIRALRACRTTMSEVQRRVRPYGPVWHGAAMVIASIDAFATLLTGERYYFSELGSGATAGQQAAAADRSARERGEEPWDK